MNVKYEVASEVYIYKNKKWLLVSIPQQVSIFDNYYEAIQNYGPFCSILPESNSLYGIAVFKLYKLLFDINDEVLDVIEIGYKVIMHIHN